MIIISCSAARTKLTLFYLLASSSTIFFYWFAFVFFAFAFYYFSMTSPTAGSRHWNWPVWRSQHGNRAKAWSACTRKVSWLFFFFNQLHLLLWQLVNFPCKFHTYWNLNGWRFYMISLFYSILLPHIFFYFLFFLVFSDIRISLYSGDSGENLLYWHFQF